MRIPRVYVKDSLPRQGDYQLGEESSHYLCKVLRMLAGRELLLFDGSGYEFTATLLKAGKKAAQVTITSARAVDRESPLQSTLGIGISRGERMDWVIQKATELGVSAITPLFTERCEVKLSGERLTKKIEHWRQIATSACEQCQRNRLPTIDEPQKMSDFCSSSTDALKLVLHHKSQTTLSELPKPASVTFIIGPEGGLTQAELELAQSHGFLATALGPRVVRTETAPLMALTAAQVLWGDLG